MKCTDPNSTNYQILKTNLRTYSSILKKIIRKAKQIHYSKTFLTCKNDIKKTWNAVNSILNKSTNRKSTLEYIALEGEKIYNTEIANQFNIFFTEIGPKLADKIKIVDNITFRHFLRTPTNNTFLLEEVDENTILNIINGLISKTSCDSDNLSTKHIKDFRKQSTKTTSYDNKPNFQHGHISR